MSVKKIRKSLLIRARNNFFAGAVVLIPIGITVYLTLFLIKISTKLLPKELNPNNYLPIDIPGIEILISLIFITFIGWLSLSFLGKKFIEIINNLVKRIPYTQNYLFCYSSDDRNFYSTRIRKKKCCFN